MTTSALSRNGLIDPSKHAEYPIVLGDRLSGKVNGQQSRLINIKYNHKSKSAIGRQQSTITRSSKGRDTYNLTIADTTPNAENTSTYSYEGSIDPTLQGSASRQSLVLVFDPDRKAFVLEPVSAQLNFNLHSSSAKPGKQGADRYTQLRTLQNEKDGSGNGRVSESTAGGESPADESNPYDYRHFLPKPNGPGDMPTSKIATPDPQSEASKTNSPLTPATKKPTSSLKRKSKPQANPLRQNKSPTKLTNKGASPALKPDPKAPTPSHGEDADDLNLSQKPAPSPGSNIIVDGDLIIDMGSPPPSRPTFKVNPADFSSNNTPLNTGEIEDDIEDLRLPSPAEHSGQPPPTERAEATQGAPPKADEGEDDDELAAEMEAAFEQSAREEEEARSQRSQQQASQPRRVPSDDESEVSEEE